MITTDNTNNLTDSISGEISDSHGGEVNVSGTPTIRKRVLSANLKVKTECY